MLLIENIPHNTPTHGYQIDPLIIQWHEASRKILRRTTEQGREVAIKLLKEGQVLQHGDVLWQSQAEQYAIVVHIEPVDVICLQPQNMAEMARACYEIGNKHAPLFYRDGKLLMPFEQPLFEWLNAAGFAPSCTSEILSNPLRANSAQGIGHTHSHHHHDHHHHDHHHHDHHHEH